MINKEPKVLISTNKDKMLVSNTEEWEVFNNMILVVLLMTFSINSLAVVEWAAVNSLVSILGVLDSINKDNNNKDNQRK